jgi:hypothetical protein
VPFEVPDPLRTRAIKKAGPPRLRWRSSAPAGFPPGWREDLMTTPRVFVSHASEDKQRFVVKFAQRLRENGVDAWLDQWEMLPGDSLVDRIFEQGLKQAQAVVIVLSAVSVQKPWVREELNHSVVKRISRGLKIIPVVIDKCEVPECLQATLWQRVDDLDQYDDAFQRILDAIFDRSSKPPIGRAPERLADAESKLPSLTGTDQRVLAAVYEQELASGPSSLDELRAVPALAGLSDEQLLESVEILEERGYFKVEQLGPHFTIWITTEGFRTWAEAYIPDYKATLSELGGLLVNEGLEQNQQLAERLGRPQRYVNALLDVLEQAGHITTLKFGSGLWEVKVISPMLKRSLEN